MGNIIVTGKYKIDLNEKTHVMGIVNVTPDSFSDGGKYNRPELAARHAAQLVQDGADIIDVGGESTRPGHEPVSADEELERVLPALQQIRQAVDVPISIDTYKAIVASRAIETGANIINDIWGAKKDPEIADVAVQYDVPIVLMHNRTEPNYDDLIDDMIRDLYESIEIAKKAGVRDEQIILDPGIGFGKTFEHNLIVMRNLEKITQLGFPVLLGTSRKSMIGIALNLPPGERMEGTGATVCLGIQKGCQIVRVHDVKPIVRMARMMDVMLRGTVVNG